MHRKAILSLNGAIAMRDTTVLVFWSCDLAVKGNAKSQLSSLEPKSLSIAGPTGLVVAETSEKKYTLIGRKAIGTALLVIV